MHINDLINRVGIAARPLWGISLQVVYNLALTGVLICGVPVLMPWILATPKWSSLLSFRWGLRRYPWEARTGGRRRLRTAWVHALSAGELSAAPAVVKTLMASGRFDRIVVSCTTLGGLVTARRLFSGDRVCLALFPFDWLWCVRSVAKKIDPEVVLLIETDIWPNFLWEMRRRGVPVFLANLRLSDGTFARYRRFKRLAAALFDCFTAIGAQTPQDHRRLMALGVAAEKVCITGNIKFDSDGQESSPAPGIWRTRLGLDPRRPVLVAGSTHDGEEIALLKALALLRGHSLDPQMILAPRDPQRAHGVIRLARQQGLKADALSDFISSDQRPDIQPDTIVVDSLGLLKSLYAVADVAFVGGSLVACGGHNPLEPAACGKPVVFGPDMRDFRLIAQWLKQGGGACQVVDADDLGRTLLRLLSDARRLSTMGLLARNVFAAHKGAVERTLTCFGLMPAPHSSGQEH